ncbi:hypothetical protein [Bremerella volcania]|uniref:hypothetical protein n=1 Tax=Bremerella volcania TaxID=2527984 RepID=UPI0013FCF613|nr:hypothetical protein [Bremerella volcania]
MVIGFVLTEPSSDPLNLFAKLQGALGKDPQFFEKALGIEILRWQWSAKGNRLRIATPDKMVKPAKPIDVVLSQHKSGSRFELALEVPDSGDDASHGQVFLKLDRYFKVSLVTHRQESFVND